MANNLAVIENKAPAVHVPSFSFSDMQAMATSFAQGGMFGSNNPHAVLSLMLVAQAEGKHPAQIMQDYHVVSGKPAKKADAMLRDFIGSGGRVEWHELTDEIADATFTHPQGGSVRITWDDKRVAQAQLGGNAMHKKYPRQMKRARCVSEGVRTVFPGATGGFYVPEEVADFDDKPRPEPKRARNITNEVTDDKRAKAEAWVADHVTEIMETDDPEGLADRTAKAAAKLEKDHPDLFEKVVEAWMARRERDAEPTDETPAWAEKVAAIEAEIDECTSIKALNGLEADFDKHSAALPDDVEQSVRKKFAAKRKTLGKDEE